MDFVGREGVNVSAGNAYLSNLTVSTASLPRNDWCSAFRAEWCDSDFLSTRFARLHSTSSRERAPTHRPLPWHASSQPLIKPHTVIRLLPLHPTLHIPNPPHIQRLRALHRCLVGHVCLERPLQPKVIHNTEPTRRRARQRRIRAVLPRRSDSDRPTLGTHDLPALSKIARLMLHARRIEIIKPHQRIRPDPRMTPVPCPQIVGGEAIAEVRVVVPSSGAGEGGTGDEEVVGGGGVRDGVLPA